MPEVEMQMPGMHREPTKRWVAEAPEAQILRLACFDCSVRSQFSLWGLSGAEQEPQDIISFSYFFPNTFLYGTYCIQYIFAKSEHAF
jgi:hypothetical protein